MPGGSQRMAATWYNAPSFAFNVNLTDGHPHQVAVYALDWDSKGRVENVQVLDANSGFLLNSQTISNFTGGVYLVWTITGHVQIVVNTLGGPNSVISGIFFGAGTSPSPILSITKTHPGAFAQGQQNAAYTLTVSNTVNAAATSGTVVVTETPPLGLTVASMAGAGWTCPSGANNCTRSDPLAGGSSYPPITALVNVSTTASNPQVNQASVSGRRVSDSKRE